MSKKFQQKMYHFNDTDCGDLNIRKMGYFGEGYYATDSLADAEWYADEDGEDPIEVKVTLEQPYYVRLSKDAFDNEYECPAYGLLKELLDSSEVQRIVSSSKEGLINDELSDHLRLLGHDGLVVTFPNRETHAIAFDIESVKIVQ